MRQTAARLNRTWLSVIGLVLLLVGLATIVIGTGLLKSLADTTGLTLDRPTPSARLFGSGSSATFSQVWVPLVLAVLGVVLAVLGLLWLLAQVPRKNEAKPFRLYDDSTDGLTRCAPHVLTDAVETQIKALPDVQDASAVLRGTAQRPDLTVKVTATDRADIPRLLDSLQTRVSDDLGDALDTRLTRLGIQVEISTTTKNRVRHITIDSQPTSSNQALT